jgi:succinate dehydrogenase / fumarate reductase flavoprotein subunit
MSQPRNVHRHSVDVVIVGGGCAGMRAALEAGPRVHTALLGKVHPVRSDTVLARDGIAAALGNVEPDDPQWHAADTIRGADGLADPDAVASLCADAPAAVVELERIGLPFSRTATGRIDQRHLSGHTRQGEGALARGCYAADRTGHHVLHTLFQNCVRAGVHIFDEFQVLDLLLADGAVSGVVAYELATGDIHVFASTSVVLATGGANRLFAATSGGIGATGDGMGLALRHGLPLQDMEFVQFHPTGLAEFGIALSRTARQAGAVLRDSSGEEFLKSCFDRDDLVTRAIGTQLHEGGDVLLDLSATAPAEFASRLPDVAEYVRTYLGPEAHLAPIPVRPLALGALGGIPTTLQAEVLRTAGEIVPGLYAAGEVACSGVHGAHRLAGNGLAEALVFGRRAGIAAAEHASTATHPGLPHEPAEAVTAMISALLRSTGNERVAPIRESLRRCLDRDVQIIRNDESLARAEEQLAHLRARYEEVSLMDHGLRFNAELLTALELGTQLDLADVLVASARARTESRGVHFRSDHPQRDDLAFTHHTLASRHADGTIEIASRPIVTSERIS